MVIYGPFASGRPWILLRSLLMDAQSRVEIYQIHAWIRHVSSLIWRRLRVRTERTRADFHYALRIVFDWADAHLSRFYSHGQDFGIRGRGGLRFSRMPKSELSRPYASVAWNAV